MNTKHALLAVSAIPALLAGCTAEPVGETGGNGQPSNLELASVSATESRAVIDGTSFPQDGEIGLFLFKDEQAVETYGESGYANVKYSYNSTKGKWTANPSIKVGSTTGYLYGYYPYDVTATDIKAIPVASSLDGDDIMYATEQTVTDKTASNTAIIMNHALARVTITVVNKGYSGAAKLESIRFAGAGIAESGALNAIDGSITATKADAVTMSVPEAKRQITADGTTYECLLVPSKADSGKQLLGLTLTIDGIDKPATLSGNNGVIFAGGVKSKITVNLSDSGISVAGVGIIDWHTVKVSGHNVTVALDGEVDEFEKDVWTMAYKDGDAVKIEAFSKSGRSLGCAISGEATCETAKTDNVYIFTISGISSDVTATVEYQRPVEISLSMSNYTAHTGRSFRLSATVLPDDAYNKAYTWSSDNPSVATVDENGRVTAIAGGTAEITATTVAGGLTATCTTTVEPYEPALPKEFSVGPEGNCKKVRFSRGNLNYTPAPDSWWFFDKQYEYGHGESQLSLFTWGYGSWSTDWKTASYQSGNFTDWGAQVGAGNIWRTLTSNEWEYLFITRTDAENKVGFATVCGIRGTIILPDEFVDPKTNESTDSACEDKKFVPQSDQNVYVSGDSWDKMQAAGALFLPAAGYRSEAAVNPGTGQYWSSSAGAANTASYMNFFNATVLPSTTDSRGTGRSVRLVTEIK